MGWMMNEGVVAIILTAFTGSILSLLWLFAVRILRRSLNARVLYGLLKGVMAGYLLPISYGVIKGQLLILGYNGGYLLMVTPEIKKMFTLLWLVWVSGMVLLFLRQIPQVIRMHLVCKNRMKALQEQEELLHRLCKEMKIHHKIRLFRGYTVRVPFVTGVIRTKIFLPAEVIPLDELKVILMHELYHCKQRDVFWKPVFGIVCCVFWFNPLVWIIRGQMKRWAEASCDSRCCEEWVSSKKYFYLLNKMSEKAERGMSDIVPTWLEDGKELIWRIECMKKVTKKVLRNWWEYAQL